MLKTNWSTSLWQSKGWFEKYIEDYPFPYTIAVESQKYFIVSFIPIKINSLCLTIYNSNLFTTISPALIAGILLFAIAIVCQKYFMHSVQHINI